MMNRLLLLVESLAFNVSCFFSNIQSLLTCCLLGLFLIPMDLTAQSVTQKGVTYKYNGKKPRTPLGNVYIKVSSSSNAVLSNSENGQFELLLNGQKMGSPIGTVTVTKKGMMIFNKQAVDEWSVRQEPLCLVLCDADEFERQRRNLISLGEREAKKRYDKKIAEIESKYKSGSEEWYKKVGEADSSLQSERSNISQYADMFARIDESEIDTTAQQALELFRNGYVDDAIKKFESGCYLEKLEQDIRAEQQAKKFIIIGRQGLLKAQQSREEHVKSINAQIEAYKLQGNWGKAADLLKGLADILQTPETMSSYAFFCLAMKINIRDIIPYYRKTVELTANSKNTNTRHLYIHSTSLYNLGILYDNMDDYEKSDSFLYQGIEERKRYAQLSGNPNDEGHVAWAFWGYGLLQYKRGLLDNCLKYYNGANSIYERIVALNPDEHEWAYGQLLFSYSLLYYSLGDSIKGKQNYEKAMDIYKRLSSEAPKGYNYEPGFPNLLNGFAEHFYKVGLFKECINMCSLAANIFHGLDKGKCDGMDFVDISCTMAEAYFSLGRNEEATRKIEELLTFISQTKSIRKNVVVISKMGNLSYECLQIKEFEIAECLSSNALTLDSTQHWIVTNLAAALLFQGKYDEAEKIYCQYKDELKEDFLEDFKTFGEAGVIPKEYKANVERIKKILEE